MKSYDTSIDIDSFIKQFLPFVDNDEIASTIKDHCDLYSDLNKKNIKISQANIKIDGFHLNIVNDAIYIINNHDLYYKVYKENNKYNVYFSENNEQSFIEEDDYFALKSSIKNLYICVANFN